MTKKFDEISEWIKIRIKLNNQYVYDENWESAIQLFGKRLERKFFKPIESIIKERSLKGEGFTIVTVQCALIEMFSAFREGKIFNPNRAEKLAKYEYSKSRQIFTNFLNTVSIFEDNFWQYSIGKKIIKNQPYNASDFYKDVRCGLMHEARTKGNWIIGPTPLTKSVKTERKFITTENDKIKIHRTVLHYKLLHYLKKYQNELKRDTVNSEILRRNFARKLDHLFDVKKDTNYNWWL